MTDHYELLGSIRSALATIADAYPHTLNAPKRGNIGRAAGTDKSPAPISVHILDARNDTTTDLRYWVGFIFDEIRDHNDDHLTTIIDGDNITAMCDHISRWADHIVTQFPDDAHNLNADVTKHASELRDIVNPPIKDWVNVGHCPLTVAQDGRSVECGTRLRAYPGHAFITCRGCGHEDTLDWWRTQLLGHRPQYVTAQELTEILTVDTKAVVDLDTIRLWAHRGKIDRVYGPRPKDQPWMYDWARVVAKISERHRRTA